MYNINSQKFLDSGGQSLGIVEWLSPYECLVWSNLEQSDLELEFLGEFYTIVRLEYLLYSSYKFINYKKLCRKLRLDRELPIEELINFVNDQTEETKENVRQYITNHVQRIPRIVNITLEKTFNVPEDNCSLCACDFGDMIDNLRSGILSFTPCDHLFHRDCMDGWEMTVYNSQVETNPRKKQPPIEKPKCPICYDQLSFPDTSI